MNVSRRTFLASASAAPLALAAPSIAQATQEENTLPIDLLKLDTPALVIDHAAFRRNIQRMGTHLKEQGIGLRPHAKTHKSARIAREQLAAGAIGICCAKISEAEALAREGIGPILITSPITTPEKAQRLVRLAQAQPALMIVVDSRHGADLLEQHASAAGVDLNVLLDLDVGTRRTGVPCGDAALEMARHIVSKPRLKFQGVQAYAGHLMHVKGHAERKQRSLEALQAAADTRSMLEEAGIAAPIFTGGGTGTFDIDTAVPGLTDLQCGSYIFMDVQYRIIGGPESESLDYFEPALFVWTSVISHPAPGRVTVDAGYKALTNENVAPRWLERPDVPYSWGGDEHGLLRVPEGEAAPALGEKLKLFVAHCDPTVNLYDTYHVLEEKSITERWPVTARGCSQ